MIVGEILSKVGIGFISIFLLKARVFIKQFKNLSLPLRLKQTSLSSVWFYQCLSVKICCISPLDSEANRDGDDQPSLLFRCFSLFPASFKNSSPREKVGKLSLFWDLWAKSLFVSIIVAKYNIFPGADNGRSREKKHAYVN